MSDLNMTKGEWRVVYNDWNGKFNVRTKVNEKGFSCEVSNGLTKDNAHLIAQAKNMYEMLSDVVKLDEMGTNEVLIWISDNSNKIEQILNACKPPEER
jgi:hypothetical protein